MTLWGKLLEKFRAFSVSKYFIYCVAALTVVFWTFGFLFQDSLAPLFVAFAVLVPLFSLCMIFVRDGKPSMTILAMLVFAAASFTNLNRLEFWIFVGILAAVALFAIFYRLVRIFMSETITFGNLFYGLVIAGFVSLLGGAGTPSYTPESFGIILAMSFAGFLFYFLFVNTIDGSFSRYAAHLLVAAGAVVLAEMAVFYARVPDFSDAVGSKIITLGWGISNNIAGILVFAIPLSLYLSVNSKRSYLYVAFALVCYIGVFFTLSRGNILFMTMFMVPLMLYTMLRTKDKKSFFIVCGIFLLAFLIVFFLNFKIFQEMFGKMLGLGLSGNGREPLYLLAVQEFMKAPLFGTGVFAKPIVPEYGGNWSYNMYHCTLLQILANFGIFGILGYLLFFWQRYTAFCRRISAFKLFALAAVLLNELYGMIDINFYSLYHILFVFVLCIAAEKERKEDAEPVFVPSLTVETRSAPA